MKLLNKIFNFINLILQQFICTITGLFISIICSIKGVRIGNHCRFYGWTKFFVGGNGKINIGRNCTFRSSDSSNLIGINRKCILSVFGVSEAKILIGNNCGFSGTVIGCFRSISLGDNVRCGANTTITDSDWHPNDTRCGEPAAVIIEDNVWLGLNVIVLKGVTIGANSIIGAGSVVTKSIPANVIAAGNPCRVIREL
jgi:acetyltransferase-like isoleucine patch superfamily enzyme